MKFVIVSYESGMFGEFFCTLLEKNKNFIQTNKITSNVDNRYHYPNYLSVIDFDTKHKSRGHWSISTSDIDKLKKVFDNKSVCIPTHWYSPNVNDCNLPAFGLRLYSNDIFYKNLAYSMWWIKSHIHATVPWPERKRQIENLARNKNYKFHNEMFELLLPKKFHNWKFRAYYLELLNDGKLDLEYYLKKRYEKYCILTNKEYISPINWQLIDVGEIMELKIEQLHFGSFNTLVLDKLMIENYSSKNLEILENKTKIKKTDLMNNNFLDKLFYYVNNNIS